MNTRRSWWLAGACLLLMAGTAVLLLRFREGHHLGDPGLQLADIPLVDEEGKTATTNSIYLPPTIQDWTSELLPITRQELEVLPPDTTFGRRVYRSPDGRSTVTVSGVLMGTDRTSIHKPEFCLPGQGLRIVRRTKDQLLIEKPYPYYLPITRIDAEWDYRQKDGKVIVAGAVYVYWFVSDTRLSNDHFQRMWWLALDLMRTGELQRWAYIGCLTPCVAGGHDAAFEQVADLIQELVPEIQTTTGPAVSNSTPPAESAVVANLESNRR